MQSETITINEERKVTLTCYLQGTGEGFGHLDKASCCFCYTGRRIYTLQSQRS
jgi:hypothetical protein